MRTGGTRDTLDALRPGGTRDTLDALKPGGTGNALDALKPGGTDGALDALRTGRADSALDALGTCGTGSALNALWDRWDQGYPAHLVHPSDRYCPECLLRPALRLGQSKRREPNHPLLLSGAWPLFGADMLM